MTLGRMFDKQDPLAIVILARHGETIWNVEGRFQGVGDSPLSELELTADAFRPRVVYEGCHVGELAGLDGTRSEAKGAA